jgi:hypothetical protein
VKLVIVEWTDSCSDGGWRIKNNDLKPSQCVTVGFLQFDEKDSIIIAQSRSDSGNWADRIAIPKGCVKRMRTLRVK